MAITRAVASSLTQGLPKQKTMLAGNSTILPGSYESIATVTVGSGGSGTISLSSIPSTYKHLQIRYIARVTTQGNPTFTFNSDSGANYSYHILYGNGSSALATGGANSSFIYLGTSYTTASTFSAGVIDVLDYANTSKYKTVRVLCGAENNSAGEMGVFSGSWRNTAAVSSITFSITNFQEYSQFALYGIK